MKNKLLIFDLDGTIVNVFGCGRRAINTTMERMYGISGAGEKLNFFSSTDYGVFLNLISNFNLKGIFFSRIEEFHSIYSEELENQIEHNESSRLLPGFPELLEYLENDSPFYVALATGNMKVGALTKLAHFGLEKYFPVGGFGDNILNKKDVILKGLKNAKKFYDNNFKNEYVYVVGDTEKDIKAAQDLGLLSIAVTTGFDGPENLIRSGPDLVFTDLSNIEEFSTLVNCQKAN